MCEYLYINLIRRLTIEHRRELIHVLSSIPDSVATLAERVLLQELKEHPLSQEYDL